MQRTLEWKFSLIMSQSKKQRKSCCVLLKVNTLNVTVIVQSYTFYMGLAS